MNADTFNARFPIGTAVVAYPGTRPPEFPNSKRLVTTTRTPAWMLGSGDAVVSVEGYAGGIALTHVDPICGSRCPEHVGHFCQRSPKHQAGICRDQKQKSNESCSWNPATLHASVKGLLRLLAQRAALPTPCWLIRTPDNCALVVPTAAGRWEFSRTFKRPVIDEALVTRLIALGDIGTVPEFRAAPPWLRELGVVHGRPIAATQTINSATGEPA